MKRLVLLVATAIIACGSHAEVEQTSSSAAALDIPGSLPIPNGWQGSMGDLYVADAWANCSILAENAVDKLDQSTAAGTTLELGDIDIVNGAVANPRPPGPHDAYMDYVQGLMDSAACGSYQGLKNTLNRWYQQRRDLLCNSDPKGNGVAAVMTPIVVPAPLDRQTVPSSLADISADAIIRAPGINACIARTLRSIMPGAASPAALTLSTADQRELLEYTRERAQQAALGYARLIHLAMTPRDPLNPKQYELQVVQNWFQDSIGQGRISMIQTAFESSLQLLTLVSPELLDMYGRSGSARTPRGGLTTMTAADEQWGGGSWRQRAFSLLYGGDPLSVGQEPNVPWKHFDQGLNNPWPAIPYVSQDVSEPQVMDLLNFARGYDVLELKQDRSTGFIHADIAGSASRLYRAVEAAIQFDDCEHFVPNPLPGSCTAPTPESLPDPTQGDTNFILWKKYHISLAHATRVVTLLAQEVGYYEYDGQQLIGEWPGAADVLGTESIVSHSIAPDNAKYYHIAKDAPFLHRISSVRTQGSYTAHGEYELRDTFFPHSTADSQGFGSTFQEQGRITGVAPALDAVREELLLANALLQAHPDLSSCCNVLLADFPTELNLISSAVGDDSLALEYPVSSLNGAQPGADVTTVGPKAVIVHAPAADTSWGGPNNSIVAARIRGNQVPQVDVTGFLIATLFLSPNATTFAGFILADATSASNGTGPGTSADIVGLKHPLKRWHFGILATPVEESTFALAQGTASSGGTTYTYLGGPFPSSTSVFRSVGGSLNTTADRLLKVEEQNPSHPKYDGFGLPIRWVPPTDPVLVGAPPGVSIVSQYLDNAQTAANAAVAAVNDAFQALIAQEQSALTVSAQAQKSAQVIQAADKSLCGDNNPNCNLDLTEIATLNSSNKNHEVLDLDSICHSKDQTIDLGKRQLACAAENVFKSCDGIGKLGSEVIKALGSKSAAFDSYAGGRLQSIYGEQYFAYTHMQLQLEQVFTAYQAAEAHRDAAQKALDLYKGQTVFNCSPIAMANAIGKGVGVSTGFANASVSFNAGPLIDQIEKCANGIAGLTVENAKAVEAFAQTANEMAIEALQATDAAKQLALSVASGNEAIEGAKLARQQAESDLAIAASTQITDTNLYRRYHNFDVWRANALMESARRYAVAARRAIEARFVVDLSNMNNNEPFVASPATWADQIYEYDLSAPAAVGLTTSTATSNGVYPNAIVDYVGNLQRFVKGYAVQRPTATTQGDSDVISLPGPLGTAQQGSLPPGVIDDAAYKWTYFCPGDSAWHTLAANGNANGVCGSVSPPTPPTLARLGFTLDPWARLDGTISLEPYTKRFNERWGRMVVNLVGTGVLDCSKASDPLTCYSQAFIRYDLTHTGPGWLTDFDQNWRSLGVSVGTVEGAKALAAEEWLDPLANGWGKPFVTAIARSELTDRPFGGGYEITLHLGPEVTLSHIERVQLLLESSYWVKQQ